MAAMLEGSCHCGAVRLAIPDAPETVTDCNCSICRRLGALWAYYDPAQVAITGDTDIWRPGGHIDFHRCRLCGCATHWTPIEAGHPRMGVNTRMFPADIRAKARIRHLDGAETWTEWIEEPG